MLWQRFGLRWLPTGMEWQAIAYDVNVCNTFMMQAVEMLILEDIDWISLFCSCK